MMKVVMRTNLPDSLRRQLFEGAVHEAIAARGGDEEWGIDLYSYGNSHSLSVTITGPIGAWHKAFYEKDKVTIGRLKFTVKDEIDRRLA